MTAGEESGVVSIFERYEHGGGGHDHRRARPTPLLEPGDTPKGGHKTRYEGHVNNGCREEIGMNFQLAQEQEAESRQHAMARGHRQIRRREPVRRSRRKCLRKIKQARVEIDHNRLASMSCNLRRSVLPLWLRGNSEKPTKRAGIM